jgi:hypothetical protein
MFNFIQKLIEKAVSKKAKRKSNSTSKKTFSSAASFESTSETEKTKTKLDNGIKIILKKFGNNPEMLLAFVEKSGTAVYKVTCANKFLKLVGYEEGFVISTKGLKSLYINTIIAAFAGGKIKFSLISEPKFILSKKPLEPYFMIQQFYKWYAKKLNLPGFEPEAQEVLQKYLNSNDENVSELSVEEILELKEAIARDVESIDFIVDMAKNTEGSQNALKKMTDGGASI